MRLRSGGRAGVAGGSSLGVGSSTEGVKGPGGEEDGSELVEASFPVGGLQPVCIWVTSRAKGIARAEALPLREQKSLKILGL